MSLTLDPVVASKLNQFRRRRTTMLLARGLCAGLIAFLICMAVIALIDWQWLLGETTRWCMTLAGYLIVFATVWITCIRRLLDSPRREEIASQVESLEPELRENLLSAVELATDDPSSVHDSPVFRSLLQNKVAQKMDSVAVRRLLPYNLVARWILAALLLGLIAFALLAFAGPQIRQLFTRAVLPGANIARVSRIQIEVLKPTPHSLTLASDETVAVVAEVSGGRFGDVTLETFSPKTGTVRKTMRARDTGQFAANLHVGDEPIDYRILAGDAITKKYRIESVARPHVVGFQKTFNYPEYSGFEPKQVTDSSGDLIELQGTKAEVIIELDQEVSLAELRLSSDDSEEIQKIALTPDGERRMRVSVPIEKAGIYKVHLVSKETGFESMYSPRYEIRPIPDLIPRTGFVGVKETNLIMPPNDLVSLRGMAEDDMPLVSLDQMISVNGRRWQKVSLKTTPSKVDDKHRCAAQWKWDLLPHKLKAGDQVTTKLVATDRKGNVGESIPLNIIIASADFSRDRHDVLTRKSELLEDLDEFVQLANANKIAAEESIKRIKESNDNSQLTQETPTLLELASRQQEKAAEVLKHIQEIQQDMPAGADAYDLELAGQVIARISSDYSADPAYWLSAAELDQQPDRQNRCIDRVKTSFNHVAHNATTLHRGYETMLAHNVMASIALDMSAIAEHQKIVVGTSMDTWDRLVRQETVVVRQIEEVEKLIRKHQSKLPSHSKNRLKHLLQWCQRSGEYLQLGFESEDKFAYLKDRAQTIHREIDNYQHIMDGHVSSQLVNVRRDLQNRAGSLYSPIWNLATTVSQENQLDEQASKASDAELIQKLQTQRNLKTAEVDLKHRSELEQFRIRRILNQARADGDPIFASDLGLAQRAVIAVLGQRMLATENSSDAIVAHDAIREIAPAYRTLEAGHDLVQTRDWTTYLSAQEMWNSQKKSARFDNPRQWDLITKSLEHSVHSMRHARMPREITEKLDRVRWSQSVQRANQKISERRWKRDRSLGAGTEIQKLKQDLNEVIVDLEPSMIEARAVLAKYAPTIPEMAKKAADELRKLEDKTLNQADQVEKANELEEKSKNQTEVAELKRQQDAINQQIDDLFDALVDKANSQDLLNKEEREAARDADDSIAMIEQPAAEMNDAMEQANQTNEDEEKAEQLSNAAEQQEKTAQALMKVAEHFEQLENGQASAIEKSRDELRNAEKEMGLARQMDQQFEKAEKLGEMAEKNAEDLMADLEKELENNPEMQKALSEIAKNTLEEAKADLKASAEEDKQLQTQNEQSDFELAQTKKEIINELRDIARQSSDLANKNVSQARHFSERGKAEEAKKQLDQANQKLHETSQKGTQTNERQMMDEIAKAIEQAKESVSEASKKLQEAKKETAEAKDKEVHRDENQRKAEKRVAENHLRQLEDFDRRNAEQVVRRAQNLKRQAEKQVRREQNDIKREQKAIERAEKNLEKNPDQQHLKNQVAQAKQRKANEEKQLDAARKREDAAKDALRETEKKQKEVGDSKQKSLDDKNPSAQLADRLTGEAIKKAEELEKRLEDLKEKAKKESKPTPSKAQLANAERKQAEIQEEVEQVAKDVARAARHEDRLKNEQAAKDFGKAAEEIQKVANNEVEKAEQKLAQAEQAAKPKPGKPNNGQPHDQQDASAKAEQAQSALKQSENALNQQAESLENAIAKSMPSQGETSESNSGESESGESSNPSEGSQGSDGSQSGQNSEQIAQSEGGKPGENSENSQQGKGTQQANSQGQQGKGAQQANSQVQQAQGQQANSQGQQGKGAQQANSQGQQAQGQQANAQGQQSKGQSQQQANSQSQQANSQSQQANGQSQQASSSKQGSEAQGSQTAQSPSQSPSQNSSQSPESIAEGEQLAQALDELDRQMSQSSGESQQSQGQPSSDQPSSGQQLASLDAAMRAAKSQMAKSRMQSKQQAAKSLAQSQESSEDAALFGAESEMFTVIEVQRSEEAEWGKLREQSAEELAKGKSEKVSEEYRKSVETYFRVLAERGREKK